MINHARTIKINSAQSFKEGSVGTFYVRAILDYLHSIGVDPHVLYDAALIAELHVVGARLPLSRSQMMLETAIAYTRDSELPLKVGASIRPRHLGVFGFAAMSSHTLADVVTMLLHYEPLVGNAGIAQLVENGDDIELHRHPTSEGSSPVLLQQALACWITIARMLTAQPTAQCDVHFSFPAPADTALYSRIFGGQVYFDAPVTKMVFAKSLLALPLVEHDPTTHGLLMLQIEKTLQTLNQSTFLQKLYDHLSTHLISNDVGINDVAAAFEISPRTLQYQLASEGFSYHNLLEKVRQDHAERYLKSSNLSLCEIANLLGYSEQSPFQHAFKRWTGLSPGEYRRKHHRASRA